jgi:hypothetical protein
VIVVDIGSVKESRFGWAAFGEDGGTQPHPSAAFADGLTVGPVRMRITVVHPTSASWPAFRRLGPRGASVGGRVIDR